MSAFRFLPEQFYPFADTIGMAVSRLLSPLLDPFDGFHAANFLFGAGFIVAFFLFLQRRYSALVAATAVALLFTSPRVWYDAMVNLKDFPEMALYACTLMAYFVAWETASTRWYVASGVLWGLALATKANALFLPLVIVAFALLTRRLPIAKLAATAVTGFAVMFAAWPWLWAHPITRLHSNLTYITVRSGYANAAMTTSPAAMLLFTTQPFFLLLIVTGIVLTVRRALRGSRIDLFLLVWIVVIAARLPFSANFDGVRHFLEIFPPLAAVAATTLFDLDRRVAAAIAIVAIIPGVAGIARMHPFENAYWNFLIGGPQGAHRRRVAQAGEYWGTSYRQGIDWLNGHAPPNSALAVPIAEQNVSIVAPLRLRRDIALVRYAPQVPPFDPDRLAHLMALAQQKPVFVMFIRRDENGNELTRACLSGLKPVARWSRDGVPLLDIYSLAGVRLRRGR